MAGLPPIINHGSDFLKDLIVRDIVTGKKIMALAISEPFAGSCAPMRDPACSQLLVRCRQ